MASQIITDFESLQDAWRPICSLVEQSSVDLAEWYWAMNELAQQGTVFLLRHYDRFVEYTHKEVVGVLLAFYVCFADILRCTAPDTKVREIMSRYRRLIANEMTSLQPIPCI